MFIKLPNFVSSYCCFLLNHVGLNNIEQVSTEMQSDKVLL
jgi:hypothetical protein